MALRGVCAYCDAPAGMTCATCGQAACPRHTSPRVTRLCVGCAEGQMA